MKKWQSKDTSISELSARVADMLRRVGIFVKSGQIIITDKSIVGIKTYGKIDFLRNYCNHTVADQRTANAIHKGLYC